MRRWALLLLLVFLPMPGVAQAPTPLLTDATGDVTYTAATGEVAPAGDEAKSIDLVGASVTETQNHFTFTVQVAQLAGMPIFEDGVIRFHFTAHDVPLYVQYDLWSTPGGEPDGYAQMRENAGENYHSWRDYSDELDIDMEAGTISATFARTSLYDSKGASPFPGRAFTDFWAESAGFSEQWSFFTFDGNRVGVPVVARDRMPDDGAGATPLAIQFGLEQKGHILLDSYDPIRTSNGEAATFIFQFVVRNTGDQNDLVTFQTTNVPSGWQVTFPQPSIMIPPFKESTSRSEPATGLLTVPVLVTTPMGHQHGSVTTFVVEATSKLDPEATGRVELGIRYTKIPQPAGHHNLLHFHSAPYSYFDNAEADGAIRQVDGWGSGTLGMTTVEDFELDQGVPIHGFKREQIPAATFQWGIYLEPGLEMGLDFDVGGTGELTVSVEAVTPIPEATLSGTLYHFDWCSRWVEWDFDEYWEEEERTPIGTFTSAEPVALGAQEKRSFTLDFAPLEAADYIPYQQNACLAVLLELESNVPADVFTVADAPYLHTDGQMILPLNEYSDPVEDILGGTEISLIPVVGQEMFRNPGTTALYEVKIRSGLSEADTFQLNLYGSNVEWAGLPAGSKVKLDPLQESTFSVVVNTPAGADDDERADLILEAVSQTDYNVRTLLRLLTIVDTEAEHPDDSEAAGKIKPAGKESPGLLVPILVAVLGAAAFVTRRQ